MIVVVADDITGAAELAGIGLLHGMNIELDIEGIWPGTDADMLVIATDTRSKRSRDAVAEIKELSGQLPDFKADLIYKKIDSVLRGHILEETETMVKVLGMKGAILVPVNPSLGRVIVNGIYYVNGEPLHETGFSEDPEFEIASSSVAELLAGNVPRPEFNVVRPEDFSGEGSIVIGEAARVEDLGLLAEKVPDGWLPGGGAEFFRALLAQRGLRMVKDAYREDRVWPGKILYLCGSTFQDSREKVSRANISGPHVCYMPGDLFRKKTDDKKHLLEWIDGVVGTLEKYGKAIAAVSEPVTPAPGKSAWISTNFAGLAKGVLERTGVDELLIEGGSTASAVLSCTGLTRLKPLRQLKQGVIRMRAENLPGMFITLKPGSYNWPEDIWKF